MIISVFSLVACSGPGDLHSEFESCLSEEQIKVIQRSNIACDNFVVKKFPEAKGDLGKAYALLGENIDIQGSFDGYFLPVATLDSIKNDLIVTKLFGELYTSETLNINYKGEYFKCFDNAGSDDKDIAALLETIYSAGERYPLGMMPSAFQYIHKNDLANSLAKVLVIFEFVLGQIERVTTAHNVLHTNTAKPLFM